MAGGEDLLEVDADALGRALRFTLLAAASTHPKLLRVTALVVREDGEGVLRVCVEAEGGSADPERLNTTSALPRDPGERETVLRLAVARRVARQHGGTLRLVRSEGGAFTAQLDLPWD
jgi:hypothetical protein